jgi:hypothetical protein
MVQVIIFTVLLNVTVDFVPRLCTVQGCLHLAATVSTRGHHNNHSQSAHGHLPLQALIRRLSNSNRLQQRGATPHSRRVLIPAHFAAVPYSNSFNPPPMHQPCVDVVAGERFWLVVVHVGIFVAAMGYTD